MKKLCKYCEAIETYPTGLNEGEYVFRHAPGCRFSDGLVVPEGQLPSQGNITNKQKGKMTKPITLPVKERDENMKCKLSPIGFHNFKYERYIWRELCLIRVSKCNYCKKTKEQL